MHYTHLFMEIFTSVLVHGVCWLNYYYWPPPPDSVSPWHSEQVGRGPDHQTSPSNIASTTNFCTKLASDILAKRSSLACPQVMNLATSRPLTNAERTERPSHHLLQPYPTKNFRVRPLNTSKEFLSKSNNLNLRGGFYILFRKPHKCP